MKKILDKLSILMLCCVLLFNVESNILPVIAFLLSIAISAITQYSEVKMVTIVADIIYTLLCIINPAFIIFLPLIVYDMLLNRQYLILGINGIIVLAQHEYFVDRQMIPLIICVVISVILQSRTSDLEALEQKFIETRDNNAETMILLTEKNRHLCESQDYEIYLAMLKERNRIAREIHDNVGHLLSRSILQVGALQVTDNGDERLASLSDTLNKAMNTVRESVHDLHDDSIDLKQAIKEIVTPLSDSGVVTSIELDFSNNITNNIKFCFIAIIKESVSNIIKHSNADEVKISLYEQPAFYQLLIQDNGKCSEIINQTGLGLANMRDRVGFFNGIIQIDAGKSGFRIFISIKK